MAYQSFEDQVGDSQTALKLEAIKLPDDLTGKAVLDIGCNEGFFCRVALERGATRVLGIDTNAELLEKARIRVPQAEFQAKSWWNVPEEKFDYIFFLSAIHYEPEQKKLLDFLVTRLNPEGVLILEGGWIHDWDKHEWQWVRRHDGVVRFPTLGLLVDSLLSRYSVRTIGQSISQSGDPVGRYVVHCKPKAPTILAVPGKSNTGKSSFARLFAQHQIRTLHIDVLLGQFHRIADGKKPDFVSYLRNTLTDCDMDVFRFTEAVRKDKKTAELAKFLLAAVCKDDDVTVIEGYPLTDEAVMAEFRKAATAAGYRFFATEAN